MLNNKNICVLGAGVSGLSTASFLSDSGYPVHIITKDDPRIATLHPEFSSLFPAASIIPHTVNSNKLRDLFRLSKDRFGKLHDKQFPGVTINRHYELYSHPRSVPAYAKTMDHFEVFDDFKHEFHPDHPEYSAVAGWRYSAYFADWPLYFSALIRNTLEKIEGFEIKTLSPDDIRELPYDIIINCTEIGSLNLFEDSSEQILHRGHLLNLPGIPAIRDPQGKVVSYNFSPGKEVYRSKNGIEQDVYCYSRQDGLVLGGSRQKGTLDSHGKWVGEESQDPVIAVDNLKLPAQILELHSAILNHSFECKLPPKSKMRSKVGYRFTRSHENGLRLETEETGDKLVIHNYGHGGAGVTLSWGCAHRVTELLREATN